MTDHRLEFPIRTSRLSLRPFEPSDFEAIWDVYRQPEVVRYLRSEAWTPESAKMGFAKKLAARQIVSEGDGLVLAIVPDAEGGVVGEVVLIWRSETNQQGEIGFVLHPNMQGKGYGAEAAQAALRVGFAVFGWHRIVGQCDARNAGSARLMEKLGMRREGHFRQNEFLKGEWTDTFIYAMLESAARKNPVAPE